jgi:hypothetical protein
MKYAVEMGCHDIHTKYYKELFWNSKVDRGDTKTQTAR